MSKALRLAMIVGMTTILALGLLFQQGTAEPNAWTIVATYQIPNDASGLAWDGTNLYCGIYGTAGSNIYRINPANGSYVLQCTGPQADAYGLTFDGTDLWTTDHPSSSQPAKAMEFSLSGVPGAQFNLPATYISGIAYDNGNFWVTRYYPDPSQVYKVNSAGTVLKQFQAPDNQPWDLCLANGTLWIADYWGDKLYQVDTASGALLDSHSSESVDPAGIVWDGQYLWYCDEGASSSYDKLYKIDLSGGGTPDIDIPATSHDFGSVVLTTKATWNCVIQNLGTASLVVDSVKISGSPYITCPSVFPLTIPVSGGDSIAINYEPTLLGPLAATVTVYCNDLITPTVPLTLTGFAVNSGPDVFPLANSHDYGNVRVRSYPLWTMEIQNTGTEVLSISDISSTDANFYIDSRVTYPLLVDPLDTVRVPIWFWPQAPIIYKTTIIITSNDPTSPFQFDLDGAGAIQEHSIGDTLWSFMITTGWDPSPKAIMPIADINGDAMPDVIVCSEDGFVRAFNGNASGAGDIIWEHALAAGSIYNQNSLIVIPDIDEDTYPDVVVGSSWGGRYIAAISGRLGNTIWTHYTTNYGDGGWIYQVDARFDYNNDGSLDVLAATGDDADGIGPRRAYCLNGLTGVPIWECLLNGPVFSVIGASDFTGDGKPDAVAGASNADETQGFVYGINGTNGAIFWTHPVSGSSVWALAQLNDANGDGTADLMSGDFSYTTGVAEILNARTGAMLYQQSALGSMLNLVPIGDVNADGYVDIMPAHTSPTANALSGKDCSFIWSQSIPDKPWCVSATNDLDDDGHNDVVFGTLYSNNYAFFMSGLNGSTLMSVPFQSPVDAAHAIPDVVGDVSYELVIGGRNGELVCYSGGTEASPNQAPYQASNPNPADGATGVALTPTMTWTGGDPDAGDPVYYDVYFGTSLPLNLISPNQPAASYTPGPLVGNQTYLWRIDTKDLLGALTPGVTWSFKTQGDYLCGDADGSAAVNISDAVYLISYIFAGGPAPNPILSGDADCSGAISISDAVYLITYIFSGGPAPCATCK